MDNVEMKNRFTYHEPNEEQIGRHMYIRRHGKNLAEIVEENTPACREQSLAITKIEEAVMWANAAIARRE